MTDTEGIGIYFFRSERKRIKSTKQHVKLRRRDKLIFHLTAVVEYYRDHLWHSCLTRRSTLFQESIIITCDSFFQNSHEFLQCLSSNPSSSPYFTAQIVDQISPTIVSQVEQQLLEFRSFSSYLESEEDSECQEFELDLNLLVCMLDDEESEEIERAIMEESMQQDVTMIPASIGAIKSLRTFTDSHFLETEKCNICMDKFYYEEGDEHVKSSSSSSMPCGHVFHHQCIVKWLQISHTCPLCRYTMPTATE